MNETSLILIGSFISGLIGGTIPLLAYMHGWLRLEAGELRRRRTDIVYEIFGSRYSLQNDIDDEQAKHRFSHAINQIPALFADSPMVMQAYDRFLKSSSNANLSELMQELAKAVKIEHHIRLEHLETTMGFNASGGAHR